MLGMASPWMHRRILLLPILLLHLQASLCLHKQPADRCVTLGTGFVCDLSCFSNLFTPDMSILEISGAFWQCRPQGLLVLCCLIVLVSSLNLNSSMHCQLVGLELKWNYKIKSIYLYTHTYTYIDYWIEIVWSLSPLPQSNFVSLLNRVAFNTLTLS